MAKNTFVAKVTLNNVTGTIFFAGELDSGYLSC